MGAAIQGDDGKPAEREKSDGRAPRSTGERGRVGGEDVTFPQHLLLFFFFLQNLSSCKQGRRGVRKRRGRGGVGEEGHQVTELHHVEGCHRHE